MTDLTPNDLSHLSDKDFNALCPQGHHAPGEEPTDEELMALAVEVFDDPCATDKDYARAAIAADRARRPAPELPAEGEVGELVAALRQVSDGASACDDERTSWITARAAELLQRLQQVPVSEPQPEPPTDEELLQIFYAACLSEGGTADEINLRGLRAVLARWGTPN